MIYIDFSNNWWNSLRHTCDTVPILTTRLFTVCIRNTGTWKARRTLSRSRRLQVETLRPSYLFKVEDSLASGRLPPSWRSHLKALRRCEYHIIAGYNNERGGSARILPLPPALPPILLLLYIYARRRIGNSQLISYALANSSWVLMTMLYPSRIKPQPAIPKKRLIVHLRQLLWTILSCDRFALFLVGFQLEAV